MYLLYFVFSSLPSLPVLAWFARNSMLTICTTWEFDCNIRIGNSPAWRGKFAAPGFYYLYGPHCVTPAASRSWHFQAVLTCHFAENGFRTGTIPLEAVNVSHIPTLAFSMASQSIRRDVEGWVADSNLSIFRPLACCSSRRPRTWTIGPSIPGQQYWSAFFFPQS